MKHYNNLQSILDLAPRESSARQFVNSFNSTSKFRSKVSRMIQEERKTWSIDCNLSEVEWNKSDRNIALVNKNFVFEDFTRVIFSKLMHLFY